MRTMHELLKVKKRILVCGLALDFCVLDTCLNGITVCTPQHHPSTTPS